MTAPLLLQYLVNGYHIFLHACVFIPLIILLIFGLLSFDHYMLCVFVCACFFLYICMCTNVHMCINSMLCGKNEHNYFLWSEKKKNAREKKKALCLLTMMICMHGRERKMPSCVTIRFVHFVSKPFKFAFNTEDYTQDAFHV